MFSQYFFPLPPSALVRPCNGCEGSPPSLTRCAIFHSMIYYAPMYYRGEEISVVLPDGEWSLYQFLNVTDTIYAYSKELVRSIWGHKFEIRQSKRYFFSEKIVYNYTLCYKLLKNTWKLIIFSPPTNNSITRRCKKLSIQLSKFQLPCVDRAAAYPLSGCSSLQKIYAITQSSDNKISVDYVRDINEVFLILNLNNDVLLFWQGETVHERGFCSRVRNARKVMYRMCDDPESDGIDITDIPEKMKPLYIHRFRCFHLAYSE